MKCYRCAAGNRDSNKFCKACGARLAVVCARCGHSSPLTGNYCGWCGNVLSLAKRAQNPHGEIKHATILFADIVGSTRLIADLNAEQASDRLRPVIAAMAAAIRQFGGTIDRSLGDGLKASFGAPYSIEGHPLLACRAALAIQQSVAALPRAPSVRVGLHSGEVITGELDTGSAVEHETTGVAVHIASRIEQLAEPGEILLSGNCRRLVRGWFEMAPIGAKAIRGFDKPIDVYRLTGARSAVASKQFEREMLSPMLGRAKELASLQHAFVAASRRKGQAIGVCALPGIGKSRLCFEFAERCRRRGTEVLEARASIYGYAAPLQPVLEMLRSFLGISADDEPSTARRKVADRLTAIDASFGADLPFIGAFLGIDDPENPAPQYEAGAAQARLRAIISRLIKAAGRAPLVIVIEDLHWLDAASESLLETLVDSIVGTRILLVVNFRPPYFADWMTRAHYKSLALSELGVSDTRALVRDLVGDRLELRSISAQIADRSGGNPFFAEELVRTLSEDGTLVGNRGQYRRASNIDTSERTLPATLEDVIGARIDRMPEIDKALLQISATIGREFPLEILYVVAGLPTETVDAALVGLTNAGLIRPNETISGPGYAFCHPLIQEVAYAMQLQARRTTLHVAVADAIAERDWGKKDELAGVLAHHYEAAGQTAAAARQLYRAATWIGQTNEEEAFRLWKRTFHLLSSVAELEDVDKMRAIASVAVLSFGFKVGITVEEAAPYSEEALRYARKFADTEEGQQVLVQYGRFQAAAGSADLYAALTEEALANPASDVGRIATYQGCLAQAHWMSGFLLKAEAASTAALATMAKRREEGAVSIVGMNAPPSIGFDVELWIKCNKSRILVWLGRFNEAKLLLSEVFEAEGTERDTPVVLSIARVASIELACHYQDLDGAHQHAVRVKNYAERAQTPFLYVYSSFAEALAKTASGDFMGSAHDLGTGLELVSRANAGRDHEPFLLAELSYAQYRGGMIHQAIDTARAAIEMARRRNRRVPECLATAVYAAGIGNSDSKKWDRGANDAFARADKLIRLTGAILLVPRLTALRSGKILRVQ